MKNMKLKFLYLLSCFCLLTAGCSDDTETMAPVEVTLSQTEFNDLSYEGELCELDLHATGPWTATSEADWCRVTRPEGVSDTKMVLEVEANLGEARTSQVVISWGTNSTAAITVHQQGLPGGEELYYKLPVIFHVIYANEADPTQNIPAETIYTMLKKANALYKNAGGEHTTDFNLEFVLAQYDPQGNPLKEPGINRVKWPTAVLNPITVMQDPTQSKNYTHFLWEPNDYINVLLYHFESSTSNIMGVSTFPYTTESHPLAGTTVLKDMNISLENLSYVHGVSINSTFVGNRIKDVMLPFAPAEWKALVGIQVADYVTLAHELGHYLGLRHTFSESSAGTLDTDLCSDTPFYNKTEYDNYVMQELTRLTYTSGYAETFVWEELFQRTTPSGERVEAHNIMDYSYCYQDEFTAEQRKRARHILNFSPLIPGPKQTRAYLKTIAATRGVMDLPFEVSICGPLHYRK